MGVLLTELGGNHFSGQLVLSFREGTAFLVVRQGQVVLAEYRGLVGGLAWQALQLVKEQSVDVELTTLTETQLKLALEFNKPYLMTSSQGPSVFFARRAPASSPPGPPPDREEERTTVTPVTMHDPPTRTSAARGKPVVNLFEELEDLTSGDLEALDRMDLDTMATKIRTSAIKIADKLDLGHLVEEPS